MAKKAHRPFLESGRNAAFPTTCWSQIAPAPQGPTRDEAIAALARDYFKPVVAYFRAAFRLPDAQAGDLAQEFFVAVLEKKLLDLADAGRGSFRGFLKCALRNFAIDQRRRERAVRRGGDVHVVSIDSPASAEDLRSLEDGTPALDDRWRRDLVEGALEGVREQLTSKGRAAQFAIFRDYFLSDESSSKSVDYGAIAARHGVTLAEVSNALQRTKALFREELRARVMRTVRNEDELREELEWLFGKGKP